MRSHPTAHSSWKVTRFDCRPALPGLLPLSSASSSVWQVKAVAPASMRLSKHHKYRRVVGSHGFGFPGPCLGKVTGHDRGGVPTTELDVC